MFGLSLPENQTWRAVTGSAYNFPSSYYGIPATGAAFPAKGVVPPAGTRPGTIQSNGRKVRGTGTKFTSDVYVGDYIYNQDVIRRVQYVESDTMLTLEQAFPVNISVAVALLVSRGTMFKSIYIVNTGAAGAIVNEAPLPAGGRILNEGSSLAYDAAAGTLDITVTN